jgi:hypothetical protein
MLHAQIWLVQQGKGRRYESGIGMADIFEREQGMGWAYQLSWSSQLRKMDKTSFANPKARDMPLLFLELVKRHVRTFLHYYSCSSVHVCTHLGSLRRLD